jgi:hypothetical protein
MLNDTDLFGFVSGASSAWLESILEAINLPFHICVESRNFYMPRDFHEFLCSLGAHCGAVGLGTALQTGRLQVRFPMVSLEFLIDIPPAALWPWG